MKAEDFIVPARRDVRASFERAAQSYDAAAVLQREVCDRLAERLELIKVVPGPVLDAGCGTGYAKDKLIARFPGQPVIGVDIAHGMLTQARAAGPRRSLMHRAFSGAIGRKPPFHAVCGDIEALPLAPSSIGLVFSNLALQWCRPAQVFAEAQRVLWPGGLLMFSTFGPDTLRELRAAFATVDQRPHVNLFLDMHDVGDLLVHAGLGDPVMEMETLTLTYADLKALLRELKAIGAHNVMPGRRAGLMGGDAWRRVLAAYETRRSGGTLPATFEVIYGHAWKPLQATHRVRADGAQVIDFAPRARR